jgi:hypothetical protein
VRYFVSDVDCRFLEERHTILIILYAMAARAGVMMNPKRCDHFACSYDPILERWNCPVCLERRLLDMLISKT